MDGSTDQIWTEESHGATVAWQVFNAVGEWRFAGGHHVLQGKLLVGVHLNTITPLYKHVDIFSTAHKGYSSCLPVEGERLRVDKGGQWGRTPICRYGYLEAVHGCWVVSAVGSTEENPATNRHG